jgi:hypothetical protein
LLYFKFTKWEGVRHSAIVFSHHNVTVIQLSLIFSLILHDAFSDAVIWSAKCTLLFSYFQPASAVRDSSGNAQPVYIQPCSKHSLSQISKECYHITQLTNLKFLWGTILIKISSNLIRSRYESTQLYPPHFWQSCQKYTMEKKQPLQ